MGEDEGALQGDPIGLVTKTQGRHNS